MHRILLYTLVVALLYLAWDARRGEVLAAGKDSAWLVPSALVARAEPDPATDAAEFTAASTSQVPGLRDRLEARVEPRGDDLAQFDAGTVTGPVGEQVLSQAEAWMEAKFPEGGATAKAALPAGADESDSPDKLRAGAAELIALEARAQRELEARERSGEQASSNKSPEPEPIYVAALARIESLGGDLPAWCGLLDLALQPAGARPFLGSEANDSFTNGDTAWITDDRGRLVARIEALDGLGLELDPSWPWVARQRRLYWSENGMGGFPARYYRLILQGNGFAPSWSGRLVLIHSSATPPQHR